MTDAQRARVPIVYSVVLVVVAVLGLLAAFQLTLDKFSVLENPDFVPTCSINPFIECTKNLKSAQGAVFGFPNPLIGLIGWSVVICVGVSLLAGARFARWFWVAMNVGLLAALAFCAWLISQSFFVLGTICVWCTLTWAVTIVAFVSTTAVNLSRGVFGDGGRAAGRFLVRWSPLLVLLLFLVVAVLAQVRFDLIGYFLGR